MTLRQAENRSKLRKEKAREAIALAMDNRWEEAVATNRAILELFQDDIEAQNRLGKACFESGAYDEARAAFARALQLSPNNAIAIKNLDRLNHLTGDAPLPKKGRKLAPQHFLGESGRTGIAALEHLAVKEVLARIAAGDAVLMRIADRSLVVESSDGVYIGKFPTRLGTRLAKLIRGGNRYEAAITRLAPQEVSVIVREEYQHPDQRAITSFPTHKDPLLAHAQAALQDMDLPEENEEAESGPAPVWDEDAEGGDAAPRATLVPGTPEDEDTDP